LQVIARFPSTYNAPHNEGGRVLPKSRGAPVILRYHRRGPRGTPAPKRNVHSEPRSVPAYLSLNFLQIHTRNRTATRATTNGIGSTILRLRRALENDGKRSVRFSAGGIWESAAHLPTLFASMMKKRPQ
jgi:hypothetical protein